MKKKNILLHTPSSASRAKLCCTLLLFITFSSSSWTHSLAGASRVQWSGALELIFTQKAKIQNWSQTKNIQIGCGSCQQGKAHVVYNVSRTCFPIHSILGIGGSCSPSACYLHNADVYVSPVVDYSGIVWHDDIIYNIYYVHVCVCTNCEQARTAAWNGRRITRVLAKAFKDEVHPKQRG